MFSIQSNQQKSQEARKCHLLQRENSINKNRLGNNKGDSMSTQDVKRAIIFMFKYFKKNMGIVKEGSIYFKRPRDEILCLK